MSITTKTGDNGFSHLLTGECISKGSERIEAYGTVDELNAILGIVLAEINSTLEVEEHNLTLREIYNNLLEIQHLLFRVGSDLATPENANVHIKRVAHADIVKIEKWIDELEQTLPELKRFILPSGSKLGAHLHHARTVCRRTERCVVRLASEEKINTNIQIFLNRLSDYLFIVARWSNREEVEC